MIRRVFPGALRGAVAPPPSKSLMQRWLLCAALAGARTDIRFSGAFDELPGDVLSLMRCLPALGADCAEMTGGVAVTSRATALPRAFPCGESGAALRFLLPVCAAAGGGRMSYAGRKRPQAALIAALIARGAEIVQEKGALIVSGALESGAFSLPGHISSQYVSGLLFALPLLRGDSEIRLTSPLVSGGYADMTLDALRAFGILIDRRGDAFFVPGGQKYSSPGAVTCEGDCSAGAVWRAANAMGQKIEIIGLPAVTRQPDAGIDKLIGRKDIDCAAAPDLMPLLCVLAAVTAGETRLTGIKRLSGKESDRPRAMAAALRALGIRCEQTDDALTITGGQPTGGRVSGANDHRVVMALAVLATKCAAPVEITDAEAVVKSYPAFWRDFERLTEKSHV